MPLSALVCQWAKDLGDLSTTLRDLHQLVLQDGASVETSEESATSRQDQGERRSSALELLNVAMGRCQHLLDDVTSAGAKAESDTSTPSSPLGPRISPTIKKAKKSVHFAPEVYEAEFAKHEQAVSKLVAKKKAHKHTGATEGKDEPEEACWDHGITTVASSALSWLNTNFRARAATTATHSKAQNVSAANILQAGSTDASTTPSPPVSPRCGVSKRDTPEPCPLESVQYDWTSQKLPPTNGPNPSANKCAHGGTVHSALSQQWVAHIITSFNTVFTVERMSSAGAAQLNSFLHLIYSSFSDASPFHNYSRSAHIARCVAVLLRQSQASAPAMYDSLQPIELLAVLLAATFRGLGHLGVQESATRTCSPIRLLFGRSNTFDNLSAFIGLSLLHRFPRIIPEFCGFSSLEPPTTEEALAALELLQKALNHITCPTTAHLALVEKISKSESESLQGLEEHRSLFLQAVLHVAINSFYFFLPEEPFFEWVQRWRSANLQLVSQELTPPLALGAKPLSPTSAAAAISSDVARSRTSSSHVVDCQVALASYIVHPLLELVESRLLNVTKEDSADAAEGCVSSTGASLVPVQWLQRMRGNVAALQAMHPTSRNQLFNVRPSNNAAHSSAVARGSRRSAGPRKIPTKEKVPPLPTVDTEHLPAINLFPLCRIILFSGSLCSAVEGLSTMPTASFGSDMDWVLEGSRRGTRTIVHCAMCRKLATELVRSTESPLPNVGAFDRAVESFASRWVPFLLELQRDLADAAHVDVLELRPPLVVDPTNFLRAASKSAGVVDAVDPCCEGKPSESVQSSQSVENSLATAKQCAEWCSIVSQLPPPVDDSLEEYPLDPLVVSLTQLWYLVVAQRRTYAALATHLNSISLASVCNTPSHRAARASALPSRTNSFRSNLDRSMLVPLSIVDGDADDPLKLPSPLHAQQRLGGASPNPSDHASSSGNHQHTIPPEELHNANSAVSNILRRYSHFQRRLDVDVTMRASWDYAKRHIFK